MGHWGDHVRGAFQFARRLSARQRKRESERGKGGGMRGESRLTIGNNQWEMRVHFRTFCIN